MYAGLLNSFPSLSGYTNGPTPIFFNRLLVFSQNNRKLQSALAKLCSQSLKSFIYIQN